MTAAMQVANAVAEVRLRAAAELIALGCPPAMITWYTPRTPGGNCGLCVGGFLAWEAHVEWDRSGEVPIATISTWWCGATWAETGTAKDWLPSETMVAGWLKGGPVDAPWMGPRP